MVQQKRVRVCRKCSGVNFGKLRELLGPEDYSAGCIGRCNLCDNKYYGYIDDAFVVCDTEDEFFQKIVDALIT